MTYDFTGTTNYKGLSNVSRGVTNREQTHVLDEIPPPVHRTIVGKSLGFGRRGDRFRGWRLLFSYWRTRYTTFPLRKRRERENPRRTITWDRGKRILYNAKVIPYIPCTASATNKRAIHSLVEIARARENRSTFSTKAGISKITVLQAVTVSRSICRLSFCLRAIGISSAFV